MDFRTSPEACSNFISLKTHMPFTDDSGEPCVACGIAAFGHDFSAICYNKKCQQELSDMDTKFVVGEIYGNWLELDSAGYRELKKFCSVECLKRYLD